MSVAIGKFGMALRKNRTQALTFAVMALIVLAASGSMKPEDAIVTLLRGLSVGAVTFLVAAGFSLIFGLMDVLNLAHGTLFMLGAYIGWTVYVRPDTFIDVVTPIALFAAGFTLKPVFDRPLARLSGRSIERPYPAVWRVLPWAGLGLALLIAAGAVVRYPIAAWDPNAYDKSPIVFAIALEQGQLKMPAPATTDALALLLGLGGTLLGGALAAASLAALARRRETATPVTRAQTRRAWVMFIVLLAVGGGSALINDPLTAALFALDTNWRFVIAVVVATIAGILLGGFMETALIRPLYARPIYQLMLTLGLAFVGREIVVALWGRTQITMPNPALFEATGKGCPATNVLDWLANQCSTLSFMGTRIRTYNEIFIILMGLVVLIAVWLLLQRSRIGMIIRAGVQDREMVEALGINVRQVFTFVFALGVGLAVLGGVLAGPAMGVSDDMGESLLLLALIALAIGGLTSYPGAAAGAVLVGLLQQFIIKYGQIGISLPLLAQPFKPSPPLVPASTVLLMVIILLVMPNGLFGRKE